MENLDLIVSFVSIVISAFVAIFVLRKELLQSNKEIQLAKIDKIREEGAKLVESLKFNEFIIKRNKLAVLYDNLKEGEVLHTAELYASFKEVFDKVDYEATVFDLIVPDDEDGKTLKAKLMQSDEDYMKSKYDVSHDESLIGKFMDGYKNLGDVVVWLDGKKKEEITLDAFNNCQLPTGFDVLKVIYDNETKKEVPKSMFIKKEGKGLFTTSLVLPFEEVDFSEEPIRYLLWYADIGNAQNVDASFNAKRLIKDYCDNEMSKIEKRKKGGRRKK